MATMKKFKVAGVSTVSGKTKIRFANDAARVKILAKNGHTGIELVELPHLMTKTEIGEYLSKIKFGANDPNISAAVAWVRKKNPAVDPTAAAA